MPVSVSTPVVASYEPVMPFWFDEAEHVAEREAGRDRDRGAGTRSRLSGSVTVERGVDRDRVPGSPRRASGAPCTAAARRILHGVDRDDDHRRVAFDPARIDRAEREACRVPLNSASGV